MTPAASGPFRGQEERARSVQGESAAAVGEQLAGSPARDSRLAARALRDGLRHDTARGTVVNAVFQVGLAGLNLLRRLVVAAFLTAAEFGVWGILLATLLMVVFLKEAGLGDKYIQQAEADQERAFQKLFTVNLLLGGVTFGLALVAVPLFAAIYGHPEIIAPGLVLALALLGTSLQSPNIIYYRRMDFVRLRSLQAVDPCVAFVLTIGLAVAGAGYWSLVIGAVVGAFSGATVALLMCPYRLAFHLERGTVRDYFSFSWPLAVARGNILAIGQASLLIATRTIGLAAAGAITLAISVTQFQRGVDTIVTQTLYPAICAVRDRADLLFEAFVKSNRLALMWGMPFGLGIALFGADLVHFVLGEQWETAIVVIQAFGIIAALDQLGFNWTAFLRALDRTRPLAVLAAVDAAAFLVITAPLLVAFGLPGFAVGCVASHLVTLAGRTYFLAKLFSGFRILRHAARAIAPTIPPLGVVLIARAIETGDRTAATASVELVAYIGLTLVTTVFFERDLLREAFGYLRPPSPPPTPPTTHSMARADNP
jgi:O-antigen/teichoic acid export membrane protein